jgi:hypothetical protein
LNLPLYGAARLNALGPARLQMDFDRVRHLALQVLDRAAVERDDVASIDHIAEKGVDLLVMGDASDVVAVTHQGHGAPGPF